MSDTPRTDEAHRVAMSLVVGDDYSTAHDEMLLHARQLERELALWRSACQRKEPVAWMRIEGGIRVYYETEAHSGMTPLYSTLPATGAITECPDGQACCQQPTGQCWGRCVRTPV
jgi:hypothetical protein